VPASERRPPWLTDEPPPVRPARAEDVAEAAGTAAPPPFEVPTAEPDTPPTDAAEDDVGPLDVLRAMALLGVPASADRSAIQRAFRERSLTCHPDKVAHLDPEFQALAERKFKRLRQAYDLLIT
jgi:DnaJ-domain-containing protein 1